MNDSQTPTYRSHTTPTGDRIEYRAPDEDAEVFEVRMPISTTGEVRNQGDDPLTRDELEGMARQINDGGLGVFLDHGSSILGGPKPYSAMGKIGEWGDATVDGERDDGEDALMATARIMDPESLPAGVNELRAAVGAIKEQVKRDFSISSSIGWREDDAYPGGNDLMEASIVGIGADPRTTSEAGEAGLVARAAVEAGADPDQLVATVRDAVESERPLGPPEDPDRFDTFEECVTALAEDGDLTEEEAERVCGAWEQAKEQDMTDDDTGDEAGTTDEEQDDNRAPDDVGPADFAEFVASHYDGLDSADVTDALDEAGGDYVGAVDVPELAAFVADVTDTDTGEAQDALDDLMGGGEEEENETDEDGEEEDDEQSETDTEEEQSVEELEERIAGLESDLEAVRNGEVEIEDPGGDDPDDEQDATTDANSEDGDPLEKYNLAPN